MSSTQTHDGLRRPLRRVARSRRTRLAVAGLALAVGPLAVAMPAGAEKISDQRDRPPATDAVTDQHRDLEMLSMACRVVDGRTDAVADKVTDRETDRVTDRAALNPSPTRIHIGCRWRPAHHRAAVGYQLWRIVDRGEREMVARGGLDMVGARDVVSAEAHLVRYAVVAVNKDGRRVGQSRVVKIHLRDGRTHDGPVRRRAHRVG